MYSIYTLVICPFTLLISNYILKSLIGLISPRPTVSHWLGLILTLINNQTQRTAVILITAYPNFDVINPMTQGGTL